MKKYTSAIIGISFTLSAVFMMTSTAFAKDVATQPEIPSVDLAIEHFTPTPSQNKLVTLTDSTPLENQPAALMTPKNIVSNETTDVRETMLAASFFFLSLLLGVLYARRAAMKKTKLPGTQIYQLQSLLGVPRQSRVR